MKKIIVNLLLVAMTFILLATFSGCKEAVLDEKKEEVKEAVEEATEDVEEQESESAGEIIELTMLEVAHPEANAMLEEAFEEYLVENNVKINMTAIPTAEFPSILQTQVAGGTPPDLSHIWTGLSYVQTYAKEGHLLDISDSPWASDMIGSVKDSLSWEGKLYGLSVVMDFVGIFYRKDIFESMNLTVPETYEELLQVCEEIKANGKVPIAVGAKTIWHPQFMPMYTFPNNVLYSKDPEWDKKLLEGKVTFASTEGWIKSFEMFVELNEMGYFEGNILGVEREQAMAMFINGDALMMVDGTWTIPDLSTTENADTAYGFIAMPAPEGYTTTVPVAGGKSFCGYKNTKYPEEVKKVIDFLASKEMLEAFSKIYSSESTFKGIDSTMRENFAEIIPAIENASYPFTNTTWVKGIQELLQKGSQEVISGKPIEDMLKEVDEGALERIEEFYK